MVLTDAHGSTLRRANIFVGVFQACDTFTAWLVRLALPMASPLYHGRFAVKPRRQATHKTIAFP